MHVSSCFLRCGQQTVMRAQDFAAGAKPSSARSLAEACYCRGLKSAAPWPQGHPCSARFSSASFRKFSPYPSMQQHQARLSSISPLLQSCRALSLPACAARQELNEQRFLALVVNSAEKSRGLEGLWILQNKEEEGAWKRKGWGARMCDMNKILAFKQYVQWLLELNDSSPRTSAVAPCEVPSSSLEPSFTRHFLILFIVFNQILFLFFQSYFSGVCSAPIW